MRLFTYCITYDTGAAPNPFWGLCTLAICKPVIRRVANVGDWVCATGSVEDGMENKVIYAMKITQKMTLEEYDDFCREQQQNKIPDWKGNDPKRRVGDCIYYFVNGDPHLRDSVHDKSNMSTDLGGIYALLSDDFYYFSREGVSLPERLMPIVKQGQAHKSDSNDNYKEDFVNWITGTKEFEKYKNNSSEVLPMHFKDIEDVNCCLKCSKRDIESDLEDEKLGCE